MSKQAFAEILPTLEQSLVASREAVARSLNTFAVFDDHERVAWKLLPEGRVVFAAIGYNLRPMCLAGSLLSDRLDDLHLMSSHNAQDLYGMTFDYPQSDVRRLDGYFGGLHEGAEKLVRELKEKLA